MSEWNQFATHKLSTWLKLLKIYKILLHKWLLYTPFSQPLASLLVQHSIYFDYILGFWDK